MRERRNEAEPAAMDGFDVLGRARVVAERRAQLANRVGQRSFRNDRIGPDGIQQFVLGDELAGPRYEVAKHVPGAWAQMNCLSVTEEASRDVIQQKGRKPDVRVGHLEPGSS